MSDDNQIPEAVYEVIAAVVVRLLRPDHSLTLHEIIRALHAMGETAGNKQSIRDACAEAVRILASQLH
ncbi:hypothetical protein [Pantoea sp. BAV 3049]|uniref:hypothetical protein n=1 Tax=Pantoea sp. BAV 3049 TaxID=2654188 RepID=UPI00131B99F1|nr:hypothetical protein [Pantoea sp. BAV 3049]